MFTQTVRVAFDGITAAWRNRRSSDALATTASPKMSAHFAEAALPVMIMAQRVARVDELEELVAAA